VPSIALPYGYWARAEKFTGADAKVFSDLKEIVLLVGRQRAGCEVELLHILELGADAAENQRAEDLNKTRLESPLYSNTSLQEEMVKTWQCYLDLELSHWKCQSSEIYSSEEIATGRITIGVVAECLTSEEFQYSNSCGAYFQYYMKNVVKELST
jgi:hypothetical protein